MLSRDELKLPWKPEQKRSIQHKNGTVGFCNGGDHVQSEIRRDFIIHAANNHHALVGILEDLMAFENDGDQLWNPLEARAKEVLEQAS